MLPTIGVNAGLSQFMLLEQVINGQYMLSDVTAAQRRLQTMHFKLEKKILQKYIGHRPPNASARQIASPCP